MWLSQLPMKKFHPARAFWWEYYARALPHFEYDPVLVDLVKIFRIVATIINQKLPRRKAFLVFSGHDFGTPDRKWNFNAVGNESRLTTSCDALIKALAQLRFKQQTRALLVDIKWKPGEKLQLEFFYSAGILLAAHPRQLRPLMIAFEHSEFIPQATRSSLSQSAPNDLYNTSRLIPPTTYISWLV